MIADVVGGVVVEVAAWACAPSLAATIAVPASRFTTLGMVAGPTLISVGSFLTPIFGDNSRLFQFQHLVCNHQKQGHEQAKAVSNGAESGENNLAGARGVGSHQYGG